METFPGVVDARRLRQLPNPVKSSCFPSPHGNSLERHPGSRTLRLSFMTSSHSKPVQTGAQAALAMAALGVVFGDIGTSPLYALRDSIKYVPALDRTGSVLGVLSLIFWSLMLVVSWKCITFITR